MMAYEFPAPKWRQRSALPNKRNRSNKAVLYGYVLNFYSIINQNPTKSNPVHQPIKQPCTNHPTIRSFLHSFVRHSFVIRSYVHSVTHIVYVISFTANNQRFIN